MAVSAQGFATVDTAAPAVNSFSRLDVRPYGTGVAAEGAVLTAVAEGLVVAAVVRRISARKGLSCTEAVPSSAARVASRTQLVLVSLAAVGLGAVEEAAACVPLYAAVDGGALEARQAVSAYRLLRAKHTCAVSLLSAYAAHAPSVDLGLGAMGLVAGRNAGKVYVAAVVCFAQRACRLGVVVALNPVVAVEEGEPFGVSPFGTRGGLASGQPIACASATAAKPVVGVSALAGGTA